MTESMQAVVNHGPHDYRLERVAKPTPGPHEVVIAIDAAGICGSDGKCFSGGGMFWDPVDPWVKAPVIPGHEFFGTVVELGEGAAEHHGVALGDKVAAEQIHPCDRCRYCTRGEYWMCQVHDIYGFQREVAEGAWAEFMLLSERARIHRMPADIPRQAGVLVEPLACAIHAVERANIRLGEDVVVAGAGPIGLLIVQVLKLKSPGRIIVTDRQADRLALARRFGADLTIDVSVEDPVERILALTDGYGCDVFIEATGHPSAVDQGIGALRKLGRMIVYGVFGEKVTIDWSIIGDRKELDVLGAHLGPYAYPTAIDLLARGAIDADAMVTHRMGLEDIDAAMDILLRGEGIKIMLEPDGAAS